MSCSSYFSVRAENCFFRNVIILVRESNEHITTKNRNIIQLINLHQEGEYWDFKKEWYTNKADLLHDFLCLANNLSSHDGLIIIGVDEENDYSICDIRNDSNRRKTQDIVSFLREKKFAGGIRPTVFVLPISLFEGDKCYCMCLVRRQQTCQNKKRHPQRELELGIYEKVNFDRSLQAGTYRKDCTKG